MSKTHELKILPEHFWPVVTGHKKAELRKNDRDFKVVTRLFFMSGMETTRERERSEP